MAAAPPRAQIIEFFHLAFVQVLASRIDPDTVALKGGANLRYFFGSHRYSEDIDFDVVRGEARKLEEQINAVLRSDALKLLLRTGRIELTNIGAGKQTETTQKWNLLLVAPNEGTPISTKIEFSRCNGDARWLVEPVPDRVVQPYGLRPARVLHYLGPAATEQKVAALALRRETQARDVFDLDLLFRKESPGPAPDALEKEIIDRAHHNCLDLPFEAFDSQLLPFLEPGIVELYDRREVWEQMQIFVADKIAAVFG